MTPPAAPKDEQVSRGLRVEAARVTGQVGGGWGCRGYPAQSEGVRGPLGGSQGIFHDNDNTYMTPQGRPFYRAA